MRDGTQLAISTFFWGNMGPDGLPVCAELERRYDALQTFMAPRNAELVKLVREAHELCSTMPVGQITGQAEVVASGAAHLFGPNPVFFESWRRQQRAHALPPPAQPH